MHWFWSACLFLLSQGKPTYIIHLKQPVQSLERASEQYLQLPPASHAVYRRAVCFEKGQQRQAQPHQHPTKEVVVENIRSNNRLPNDCADPV